MQPCSVCFVNCVCGGVQIQYSLQYGSWGEASSTPASYDNHRGCTCCSEPSGLGADQRARVGAAQPAKPTSPPSPQGWGQQGQHAELDQLQPALAQWPCGGQVSSKWWVGRGARPSGDQAQKQGQRALAASGSTAPHPKPTEGLALGCQGPGGAGAGDLMPGSMNITARAIMVSKIWWSFSTA